MTLTEALSVIAAHVTPLHGLDYCRHCWRVLTGVDSRIAHCPTCPVVAAWVRVAQGETQ